METIQQEYDRGFAVGKAAGQEEGRQAGHAAFQKAAMAALRQIVPAFVEKADTEQIEDVQTKIDSIIQSVPPGRQRDQLMAQMRKLLHKEQMRLRRAIKATKDERERVAEHLKSGIDHLDKLAAWGEGDLRLQKPITSMVGDFYDALREARVYDLPAKDGFAPPSEVDSWLEMASSASVYLVQHDWAGAFRNAQDYIGGEIRLPDDACAFEFRINDRHVISFATDADGALYQQVAVQVRKGWVLFPVEALPEFGKVHRLVNEQIRAVAIALDSEVAVTEVVRSPHRSVMTGAELWAHTKADVFVTAVGPLGERQNKPLSLIGRRLWARSANSTCHGAPRYACRTRRWST